MTNKFSFDISVPKMHCELQVRDNKEPNAGSINCLSLLFVTCREQWLEMMVLQYREWWWRQNSDIARAHFKICFTFKKNKKNKQKKKNPNKLNLQWPWRSKHNSMSQNTTLQTTQWNFKFWKKLHSVFVGMDLTILDTVFVKCYCVLIFRATVEFSKDPWISSKI